jgi:hypothetical protein
VDWTAVQMVKTFIRNPPGSFRFDAGRIRVPDESRNVSSELDTFGFEWREPADARRRRRPTDTVYRGPLVIRCTAQCVMQSMYRLARGL